MADLQSREVHGLLDDFIVSGALGFDDVDWVAEDVAVLELEEFKQHLVDVLLDAVILFGSHTAKTMF